MQRRNVEKNKIEKQIENLIRRVSIFGIDTRFYFYGGLGFSGKRQTGMITSKQARVTDKKKKCYLVCSGSGSYWKDWLTT